MSQEITNTDLFSRVAALIEQSRQRVASAVNTAMVYTYYEIGRYIVEYEQEGASRAKYGKKILEELANSLLSKYGKGWSVETLKKCRQFYKAYSIGSTPQTESSESNSVCAVDRIHKFVLSWNHYQILMRIENPQARSFYEIECARQQWSVRQLQRQSRLR